jgi:hypothetical protein
MRMIVATFPAEAPFDDYVKSLAGEFGIEAHAMAIGSIGAYGAPYDGHRLVAVWVRREFEPAVRALAEGHGGSLHDVSRSVIVPRWVEEAIAAQMEPPLPGDGTATPPP